MPLDITKLQNVTVDGKTVTTAKCPACGDDDTKGIRLFMFDSGAFGCSANKGPQGKPHRQEIFKLVGVKDEYKDVSGHRSNGTGPTPDQLDPGPTPKEVHKQQTQDNAVYEATGDELDDDQPF